MRTVSFVGQLELEVEGAAASAALAVADLDGDGQRELAVGTEAGHLYVFKGLQTQPLCHLTGLGLVTALCCGPIAPDPGPDPAPQLCAVTGNGWLHLFHWDGTGLRRRHAQRIPANVKSALLYDVDGDGRLELVVALTDRVVRVYRWRDQDNALAAVNKCELMQQVGTVSPTVDKFGRPCLLVSQPGGALVQLQYRRSEDADSDTDDGLSVHIGDVGRPPGLRPGVSCEVLACVAVDSYAICTLDGHMIYVRHGRTIWSTVLHHQLFGLTKMDVTSDGSEELVVSSWDGRTFIVNQEGQAVQFLPETAVTGFTAGLYGVAGSDAPCLVYAAAGRLTLYHSVRLPVLVTETLTDTVAQLCGASELSRHRLLKLCRWCLYGFRPSDMLRTSDTTDGAEMTDAEAPPAVLKSPTPDTRAGATGATDAGGQPCDTGGRPEHQPDAIDRLERTSLPETRGDGQAVPDSDVHGAARADGSAIREKDGDERAEPTQLRQPGAAMTQ